MVENMLLDNDSVDYGKLVKALEKMAMVLFLETDTNESGEIELKEFSRLLRGTKLDKFTEKAGTLVMGTMMGGNPQFRKKPGQGRKDKNA